MAAAEKRFGNVFAVFADKPLSELADNPDALRLGRNIFLNRCATCHGSDGRGAKGFPNLTDAAWLWGNAPDTIIETITNGRTGTMPALGPALGEQGVTEVIAYLRALPKLSASAGTDPADLTPDAAAGQQKYMSFCIGCHGADAKGNQLLGSANLADSDWLHGSTDAESATYSEWPQQTMPAQRDTYTGSIHDWLPMTQPRQQRRSAAVSEEPDYQSAELPPPRPWSTRAQLLAAVLWPSLLAASFATMLFFAFIDPGLLHEGSAAESKLRA